MIAGYRHFLNLASRLQWVADDSDLTPDAAAWPHLEPGLRSRLTELVAGFCIGETHVAEQLGSFARVAQNPDAVACFQAQRGDETRHARFFDRVAAEVLRVPGSSPAARRAHLRQGLAPGFLQLFEQRLPAVARQLGDGDASLCDGVGLYHMVLEGVVFSAGQLALLEALEAAPQLTGLRRGAELVARDERWHVGFGIRCLKDVHVEPHVRERIGREGELAADLWGAVGDQVATRAGALHRRRMTVLSPEVFGHAHIGRSTDVRDTIVSR